MKTDLFSFRREALRSKYRMFRPHALEYYGQISSNASLSREQLQLLSQRKFSAIVKHAYLNTDYYRRTFAPYLEKTNGEIHPELIETLPILEKETVRSEFTHLVAGTEASKFGSISTTGGSTGKPLKTIRDTRVPVDVIQWRTFDWWGVPHFANCARAWRIPNNTCFGRVIETIKWWPGKVVRIDASSLSPDAVRKFLKSMVQKKCEVLFGYVGAIQEVSDIALEEGLTFPDLKAVWTTAAPLSESIRKKIKKGFGVSVYDEYGSCEIMRIAAQKTETGPLRIFSDLRYLEIVDDHGNRLPDGEVGNILVTDLENRVFPLIRYKIGDRGRIIPKRETLDNSPFPVMDPVLGRVSEVFRFPNGISVPGEYLTTLFDEFPSAVENFQVIQGKDFSVTLSIVPGRDIEFTRKVCQQISDNLKKLLREPYPVKIQFVNHIEHDRGKLRYIKSELSTGSLYKE